MARKSRPTDQQAPSSAQSRPTDDRAYRKPTLISRERLAQVSADSKVSGIATDGQQSDRRLKEDIRLVGRTFDGLDVYIFRYKQDPVFRMGVMAQEVLLVHPEAVFERDGYLAVDYSRIGTPPLAGQRRDDTAHLRRSYRRPTLVMRERLSQIAAGDSKPSGVVVTSDRRLKDDIRLVGRTFDGLNIYTFRYKGDRVTRMGVMAQEVLELYPDAVAERDGYLAVDYGRVGAGPIDDGQFEAWFGAMAAAPRRSYARPSLVARQRLSQVSADSKTSGVSISDRRLKRDIRLVGRSFDGLNIYVFRYRNDPTPQMGVMAQEVLAVHPEAVSEIDGYLAVDYGRIGAAPATRQGDGEATLRRSYGKPSLMRRERLSQVSATLTSSGITTDSSDIRLKQDIRLVGRTVDGLNVYTFRYRNDAVVRMGVMAQEVLRVHPEAVGERDGYLTVDYSRIGTPPKH